MAGITIRNSSSNALVHPVQTADRLGGSPAGAFNVDGLRRPLRKRKLTIIIVTLLVITSALAAALLSPPVYFSAALIQVNQDSVRVLPYSDIADSGSGVYYEVYMATQDQILRSPNLMSRVAARLRGTPADGPLAQEIGQLGSRLQVKRVPNSQLFQVGYRAPSPHTAAAVANMFAEEYVTQHLESRQAKREMARDSLEMELKDLQRRLHVSERGLLSYAQSRDILNVGTEQASLVQKRLSVLDQQVSDAEAEELTAQTRLDTLKNVNLENFPDNLATPLIETLSSRLLQAEQDLNGLLKDFGDNWPAVIAKRNEMALIRDQLAREKKRALAGVLEQAQLQLKAAQRKLAGANAALAQQKELVSSFNNALIQYRTLEREVQSNQRLYESVLERVSQTSVQKNLEFGNIQILEPATPNDRAVGPTMWQNAAWATALGLTLGIGAAFLRDAWDSSLSTLDDAVELTRLPGLGIVPASKYFSTSPPAVAVAQLEEGERLEQAERPVLPAAPARPSMPPEVAEAIRGICASILLSQSDQQLRLITVTSALPGEGKTTVVAEIGRALAQSGAKTLLVEADMRKPALAGLFGVAEDRALSLYLSGHVTSPFIFETEQPNLLVIPAGPNPPNPLALLGSERMNTFLRAATEQFRFVLLDTPPVLAVADARILSARTDGVVVVSRARSTSKNLVSRAKAVLENSGANVLGLVLTHVDLRDVEGAYYRHYYSTVGTGA
jgi:capsular exopolysaccharide synthesis family protein